MDVDLYLALDEASENTRYEYIDGYVYAMAGGTAAHDSIKLNTAIIFDRLLPIDGPCRLHGSDVKVAVDETKYFYPDFFVTCDEDGLDDTATLLRHPALVVECISPSTEKIDRDLKRIYYQSLASLHTYIIIRTDIREVEVHQRTGEGWEYRTYASGETFLIKAMNITVPVDELYKRTKVPA